MSMHTPVVSQSAWLLYRLVGYFLEWKFSLVRVHYKLKKSLEIIFVILKVMANRLWMM